MKRVATRVNDETTANAMQIEHACIASCDKIKQDANGASCNKSKKDANGACHVKQVAAKVNKMRMEQAT